MQHTERIFQFIVYLPKGAKQAIKNIQIPAMILVEVFESGRVMYTVVAVHVHERGQPFYAR